MPDFPVGTEVLVDIAGTEKVGLVVSISESCYGVLRESKDVFYYPKELVKEQNK